MEWSTLIPYGFAFFLGFSLGLLFRPTNRENSKEENIILKTKNKIEAKYFKKKAYSPSADPERLMDELEYSYFDSSDGIKK